MHEAEGSAVLRSTAGDSSRQQTTPKGRDRRWGIVEMKLVVSSLRGRTERVLVRQTVASGSDKEDSPAIPPRQLKSRSVGETYQAASAWLRGRVCSGGRGNGAIMAATRRQIIRSCISETAANASCYLRKAANNVLGRGGEKGTAGGQSLSAFCSRRLLRATNRAISHEQ